MVHNHHGHNCHGHGHGGSNHGRAFVVGIALNMAFVVVEGGYGVLSHSMALLADAGHNLSDVLALVLAWLASRLSQRQPSKRFTYGLRSSSILAALANATLLLVVSGGILWEAVVRLFAPEPVAGETVMWVAAAGIVVNAATALPFLKGRAHDLNVRAAFQHMAADAVVSAGVVAAGFGIMFSGWMWLDPAVSMVVVAAIIWSTWGVLAESVGLALHAVPPGVDASAIRRYLESLSGTREIHDLHIWGMSTTETALTVHLVMPGGHPGDRFLADVCTELHDKFRVGHATIQVEVADEPASCPLAPDHVV